MSPCSKVSTRSPSGSYDWVYGPCMPRAARSASAYFPSATSRRTSASACGAFGLFQSRGPPDQSVSSLSWSRSRSMPPNTIAPSLPLPTGSASTHCCAGRRYQSVRWLATCCCAAPAAAGAAASDASPPAASMPPASVALCTTKSRLVTPLVSVMNATRCGSLDSARDDGAALLSWVRSWQVDMDTGDRRRVAAPVVERGARVVHAYDARDCVGYREGTVAQHLDHRDEVGRGGVARAEDVELLLHELRGVEGDRRLGVADEYDARGERRLMHRGDEGLGQADRFDDDVGAIPVGERSKAVGESDSLGIDGLARAGLAAQRQLVHGDVHGDDACATTRGTGDGAKSDRAAADHHDHVTVGDAASIRRV